MKKIKKVAKIEKVFGNTSGENKQEEFSDEKKSEYDVLSEYEDEQPENDSQEESQALTQKQLQKQSEIETVKSKISKILKSTNIEIVDENFGDEYELDESDSQKQSQQDYDTLKALFGDKDRNKKDELTLTVDDFDYTYVGKYIEEFDLMHVKNIKHIRLKNPYAKKIKKALIAASVVFALVIGGFAGFYFTRQTPVTVTSVTLSQNASTSIYHTGDDFCFDGLDINVKYSDKTTKKVKLSKQYLDHIEGGGYEILNDKIQFLGGSVLMVFNYEGNTLNYSVEVKNRELQGIKVSYADGIFDLKKDEYIVGYPNGKNDFVVKFDYGDYYGYSKNGSYSYITIKVDGMICSYENGRGWKVPKATKDSILTIEYNNEAENQYYKLDIRK